MTNSEDSRKYVVFDVDGVLADFSYGFSRLALEYFPIAVTDTMEQLSFRWLREQGVSKDEENALWDEVTRRPDFWFNLPCLLSDNDKRAMYMLVESGVDIIYLTNRHHTGTMLGQTEAWIFQNQLPYGLVVPTLNKDLHIRERMIETVGPVFRLDGETHHDPGTLVGVIEDNPRNLVKYARGIATWYWRPVVYVAARAYNEGVAPKLPRVSSVMAFCDRMLNYLEHPPKWAESRQSE